MSEKQFYKLDEYKGKLPNPTRFPVKIGITTAVEGIPNAFSDGFIMDLEVSYEDKERLKDKIKRTVGGRAVELLLEETDKAKTLLSKPRYIYDDYIYLSYVLFTPDNKPIAIQVQYFCYFRNRYPKCKFYTDKNRMPTTVNAVRVGTKLVGLWMAVFIPEIPQQEEIKDEKGTT